MNANPRHPTMRARRSWVARTFLIVAGFLLAGAGAALAFFVISVIDPSGNDAVAQATSLVAPTAPTATEAGATAVTVGWTPHTQPNGVVVQYTATASPGTAFCTTSGSSCQVSGLSPGTAYTFSIVASLDNWTTTPITSSSFTMLGVTTSSLPNATVGASYSTILVATGGSGSYTSWALSTGSAALPGWAHLNTSTGAITGTPTSTVTTTGLQFTVTDSNGFTATSGSMSLAVNQGANTITITSTAPGSATVGGATYTPTATATSGDTVVITSATTSVCTISSGVVHFVGVGTCTLDFNDTGNANYNAATQATQSFSVGKGTSVITITSTAPGSATVGGATYTPTATATSGDTVVITSATTSVCTISSGVVSFVGVGTCTLDFNDTGNANYNAATQATQSFSVGKGTSVITITSTAPGSATVGGATYTPTATATSGDTVVITSATTSVCTISSGVVHFVGVGTCTLDFNDTGNANYNAATQATQSFSVGKGTSAITITSTAPGSATVGGATYTPTATATSGDTVVITSATTSVCTISSGVVSFVGVGTCTLDFNDTGNANYNAATQATQSFSVGKGTSVITITSTAPGSATVGGATYTPTATATSGDTVVITSATTSVCTISSGVVHFVGVGTCTLDFNDTGNANYNAATQATQSFSVGKGTSVITITSTAPGSATVGGATYTPTATATSGDTVVITSATTSVCTISSGVVSFVGVGTCTLDFNDTGNANYNAATQATQSFSVGKGTSVITITSTAPGSATVGGATYTPTATATSGDTVVITSATTSVCTISSGVVHFVGVGTCTLDFNDTGNANYNAATQATQSFSVGKGTSAITITSTAPGSATVGGATYTPTATATSGDTVVITSATTSVCTISSGVVSFVGVGTCTLDFNDTGNANYNAATQATQSFSVGKGTSVITITSTAPGSATVGGATYTPTATATSGDTVVITSATTSVCTISSGVVSFVGVGTCTLDFNEAGNANYNAATQATQSFSVGSGATGITIASPNTFASNSSSYTTGSFTATANTLVLVVVTFADAQSQSCPTVSTTPSSALTSITSVANESNFASTSGDYGVCAYWAKGGGTSGTVKVAWSGGVDSAAVQMIDIPDTSATVVGDNGVNKNSGSSPQSPAVTLSPAATSGDYEVYVGDATIDASTLPTWSTNAPSGFTQVSTQSESTSTYSLYWNSAVYYGPAATTVTGSVTDTTGTIRWGALGIEIHP